MRPRSWRYIYVWTFVEFYRGCCLSSTRLDFIRHMWILASERNIWQLSRLKSWKICKFRIDQLETSIPFSFNLIGCRDKYWTEDIFTKCPPLKSTFRTKLITNCWWYDIGSMSSKKRYKKNGNIRNIDLNPKLIIVFAKPKICSTYWSFFVEHALWLSLSFYYSKSSLFNNHKTTIFINWIQFRILQHRYRSRNFYNFNVTAWTCYIVHKFFITFDHKMSTYIQACTTNYNSSGLACQYSDH